MPTENNGQCGFSRAKKNNSICCRMKRTSILICFALLLIFRTNGFAQQEDNTLPAPEGSTTNSTESEEELPQKGFNWHKLRLGGNLSASFGSYTIVGADPRVGYMITKWLQPGIGGSYYFQYLNQGSYRLKAHTYGGKVYVKAFVWRDLFLLGEGTLETFTYKERIGTVWNPQWSSISYGNVFAGGGYNVQVGERAWLSLSLTTNLITNRFYDKHRLYFNTGFEFGL